MTRISSEQGWNQLTRTLGRTMPQRLKAAREANQAILDLMKAKRRH